jgi:uncharacterized protein (TIGR03790 family)
VIGNGRRAIAAAAVSLFLASPPVSGQTSANVLLVVNRSSPVSVEIGEYYAAKRGVPREQVLSIEAPTADQIDRRTFDDQINRPIAHWLSIHGAQDRILYIVLTKDVPLRIAGTTGLSGGMASVDSELTLLYRRMTGQAVPIGGRVDNPYFAGTGTARPFSHAVADIYLVTRLDGFSAGEVKALVDRSLAPAREGRIVLDERGSGSDRIGDEWLEQAAARLTASGFSNVFLERTTALAPHQNGVLGYYSWGSNDASFRSRRLDVDFVPGAIAGTYVSTDARTFREPPADWAMSGNWTNRKGLFADSPQSLTGDLIRSGVTAAAGHVAEPYLDATIRPSILFPAYVSGLNVAEAFYAAMPFLSWQTVVVGDPLCAPFRTSPVAASEIDAGTDALTELPSLFSDRRVALLAAGSASRDAIKLVVKAERQISADDRAAARASLEQALKIDPATAAAERDLAQLDSADHRFEDAARRYQHLVSLAPNDALALNNLAYTLGVHLGKPEDALRYAVRAATLLPRNPSVLDTLGWLHHLTGDDQQAETALRVAREAANADIWIHSATVHLALGDRAAAEKELAAALEADPSIATRDDVVALKRKLAGGP